MARRVDRAPPRNAHARWSVRVLTIADIPVRIHVTFVALLAWIGFGVWRESGLDAALSTLAIMLTLFVCIVLHEYGHALVARAFGIRTRDITLWPIGGVASLERIPEKPRQELAVAIAGPAVNVAIFLALAPWSGVLDGTIDPEQWSDPAQVPFLTSIAVLNLTIAFFNLIPAFPMDGGRVLRALVALAVPHLQATRIAVGVSRVLALGLGWWGMTQGGMLVVIAAFVWLAAGQELAAETQRVRLASARVADAVQRRVAALHGSAPLETAARELLDGSDTDFVVVGAGGAPTGVLSRGALLQGLASRGPLTRVADIATLSPRRVDVNTPLAPLVQELLGEADAALAFDGPTFVGLVTAENLAEYLAVRDAAETFQRRRSVGTS